MTDQNMNEGFEIELLDKHKEYGTHQSNDFLLGEVSKMSAT
jgi:hypothetical protein